MLTIKSRLNIGFYKKKVFSIILKYQINNRTSTTQKMCLIQPQLAICHGLREHKTPTYQLTVKT